MAPIFEKITIIGIGLIGSSIAMATRRAALATHICGCDVGLDIGERVSKLGLVDRFEADPARAVADADLVIMAVPVGAMAHLSAKIVPHMKKGAVLTDTGSTKRSVVRDVSPHVSDCIHWVPSHPLAGTEHSGPEAGVTNLFDGRYWLVLPLVAPEEVVAKFESFVTGLGSVSERMDAEYHDKVTALTSQLPHLIAYTIVSTAVNLEQQLKNDVIRFSASGFRDFTRLASSDPVMWRDVFLNNDLAVLEMLQRFSEDLSYLQRAIRWQEGDKLEKLFHRTREIRRSIIDAGQS